jgi:DNA-binding NtrC family response regulator
MVPVSHRLQHSRRIPKTGADRTLFFDEIGELPVGMQSKLLRLLQEGSYRPIGFERSRRARCRFVFATNRDLENEVTAGRFRKDLYYRIAVFQIHLPPLRKRREDLPEIVRAFIAQAAPGLGSPVREASSELLSLLERYDWPGNVRELQNLLLRSMVAAGGTTLEVGDVGPVDIRRLREAADERSLRRGAPAETAHATGLALRGNFRELVDNYKRELILGALKAAAGNKRRAAGAIQISPQTLDYQIRSLGLEYVTEIRVL